MFLETWVNAVLALLAILNPIGNLPVFTDMTADLEPQVKKRLFNLATLTGFLTLVTMTLTGKFIMQRVFQIDISEFRVAGGLLLTVISVRRITAQRTATHTEHTENILDMGVVPMAVPLLVGPGSIVTAIIILDRDGLLVVLTAIVAVFAVTWTILRFADIFDRILGQIGRLVLSRILWIFIAAIGVHFFTSGIKQIFNIG